MTKKEYETIQRLLSLKMFGHKDLSMREQDWNSAIISCKSVITNVYKKRGEEYYGIKKVK